MQGQLQTGVSTNHLDGIDLSLFAGGTTVAGLYHSKYEDVPTKCGVYIVIRDSDAPPSFDAISSAGWFKNRDPTCSIDELESSWVKGAKIVYVGKAAGARGLRQRIRELVRFGNGHAIGHAGGRRLWHLRDRNQLRICWVVTLNDFADAMESLLIHQFRETCGVRPFANTIK